MVEYTLSRYASIYLRMHKLSEGNETMGYEDNEQEIDLKAMFFDALHHWRSILLAGLIGALLLGGWKGFEAFKNRQDLQNAITAGTVTESSYSSEYLAAKDAVEAKEKERREQTQKARKLQAEITKAQTTVSEGEAIIAAQTEVIELRNEQIVELQLLKDKEAVIDCKVSVAEAKAAISQAKIDMATAESEIAGLEAEKSEYDEKIESLTEEIEQMEASLPEKVPSMNSVVKKTIKFAVIGFVAGAAILFMIYIVIYVLKPMLRMPDDIRTVYGYPVLGVLNKKVQKKLCAIDKWILKAEGCGRRPCDEEIVKTAAVSIANTAEPGASVALMTTLKENDVIRQIAEQLKTLVPGMKFVLLTEGVSKAANVDELSRCDAAVLLEERNTTSMGKLTADVNQIRLFGKKVLGAIVM